MNLSAEEILNDPDFDSAIYFVETQNNTIIPADVHLDLASYVLDLLKAQDEYPTYYFYVGAISQWLQ